MRRTGALVAVAVAVGLAGCGSSGSSDSSSGPITVYSGQHEQTVAALVAAFEKRTGIRSSVRSDDEASLADQIVQEGRPRRPTSSSPRTRRRSRCSSASGLLAPVDAATLARTPAKYNDREGRWVALSARSAMLVYNTDDLQAVAAAEVGARPRRARSGRDKLGIAPERDRLPADRHRGRARYGKAAARHVAQGPEGQRATSTPTTRRSSPRSTAARSRSALINHYYWYRLRDEVGKAKIHSAQHYFAAGDAGHVVDVSGAAASSSRAAPGEAQQFLAFLVSKPAQEIIATTRATSTRSAPASSDDEGPRAVRDAEAPDRSPSPSSATAQRARAAAQGRPALAMTRRGTDERDAGRHRSRRRARRAARRRGCCCGVLVARRCRPPARVPRPQAARSAWGERTPLLIRPHVGSSCWNTVGSGRGDDCSARSSASRRPGAPSARTSRSGALWTVALVLPLAVPDFVLGYGWISLAPACTATGARCS